MAASSKLLGRSATARPAAVSRKALRVQATSRVDRYSKNDIIVSPSILSADFARLGDEVRLNAWTGCIKLPSSRLVAYHSAVPHSDGAIASRATPRWLACSLLLPLELW